MKIAFRTDASLQIGTGHVMRCLTLADALRARGGQSTFICRPHAGHLLDLIRQRGHIALALAPSDVGFTPPSAPAHARWLGTDWASDAAQTRKALGDQAVDWLVVDHYALDRRWELALRPLAGRTLVIDDLADRSHTCDVLLDQNLGRAAHDYCDLLPPSTPTLIGPQFALLRAEFAQWRERSLHRRALGQINHLLITMGGVDQGNATGQVLEALKACVLPAHLQITVVMGPHAPWLAPVQAQAAAMPWSTRVLVGVNNMAQLMADSDLAIGAAGSTSWERCCLGLPCILLVLADNQREAAAALVALQAAVCLDEPPQWAGGLKAFFEQADALRLRMLSTQSAALCDGNGTDAVSNQLMAMQARPQEEQA